jgi:hypothetical protein
LLLTETIQNGARKDGQLKKIDFFLQRASGMHLLLLLLNAHYNKRAAGRLPGWTFGILKSRIRLSERSLRLLIRDGLAKGVLIQICGVRDRRARVYCVAPVVVVAWEALFAQFCNTIPEILGKCSPDKIANLDFGSVTRDIAGHEMAAIIPQMWASLPLHARLAGAMISANTSQGRAR